MDTGEQRMANEEQLAWLKSSVEEWNEWRNACPNEAVDLRGAGFAGANLNGVSLNEADLAGANLNAADLVEADLSGADLLGARLSGANLYGATLAKADLFETIFGSTNLKDARGLEECNHYGPSTLDLRTIQRSWPLPINFLRGCGLPENLITYLPSLVGGAIEFYSCFISYSHADKSFARRLHDSLRARGIRVWLDEHQLLPGTIFMSK